MRNSIVLGAALGACLLSSAPNVAFAQERDPRENEAKTACLAGKPERGIELLAQLYAETNDPTYIFNQGRCFEQNGKATEALTRFREYLRKSPNLSADEKAQVQAHITDMEEQTRKQAAPAAPTVAAPAPAAPARDTGKDLRTAGIATAAVGVAIVAVGVYFGAQTKSLESDVTNDAKNGMFSQAKYDEGQRDELLQWLGYGVGAAALVTGGLLYVMGAKRDVVETSTVTAMPTVGPSGIGGSLRVTF